jgi:hypothetical protein
MPADLPQNMVVDVDGYPDEAALAAITAGESIGPAGARWMIETLPRLAQRIPYAACEVSDATGMLGEPIKRIIFHTQGWSGCEDFVAAVLANTMLHMCYYAEWRRGGHHTFEVSLSMAGYV